MKHNFEKAGFSLKDAREFEGKLCRVTDKRGTVQGVIRPLTRSTTFVGDNIIYNIEVLEIEDGLESSSV